MQVTPQGDYVAAPPKLSKLRYISMMRARSAIIYLAHSNLAKVLLMLSQFETLTYSYAAGTCALCPSCPKPPQHAVSSHDRLLCS